MATPDKSSNVSVSNAIVTFSSLASVDTVILFPPLMSKSLPVVVYDVEPLVTIRLPIELDVIALFVSAFV